MVSESLLSCILPFLRDLRNQWPWISLRGHPRSSILVPIESTYIRGAFKKFCNSTIKKNGNVTNYTLFFNIMPTEFNVNHRLNGSSSPLLAATCLSYGSLCDFLTFFPEPTWRSHPSTDFDAKWLKRLEFMHTCAFWGKNRNFLKPLTLRPPKPPKFAQFWSGLLKYSLDFAFNVGGLTSKHPLFFIWAQ